MLSGSRGCGEIVGALHLCGQRCRRWPSPHVPLSSSSNTACWSEEVGSSWVGLGQPIPEDEQTEWLGMTYGFWVKDRPLLIWLTALGELVDESPDVPDRLRSMRAEWISPYNGAGCVYTYFDEYVTDEERCSTLFPLVMSTLQRLLDVGGDYHLAFSATRKWSSDADSDQPLRLGEKIGLIEVGANLARLLRGVIHAGEHARTRWGYAPDVSWTDTALPLKGRFGKSSG